MEATKMKNLIFITLADCGGNKSGKEYAWDDEAADESFTLCERSAMGYWRR